MKNKGEKTLFKTRERKKKKASSFVNNNNESDSNLERELPGSQRASYLRFTSSPAPKHHTWVKRGGELKSPPGTAPRTISLSQHAWLFSGPRSSEGANKLPKTNKPPPHKHLPCLYCPRQHRGLKRKDHADDGNHGAWHTAIGAQPPVWPWGLFFNCWETLVVC